MKIRLSENLISRFENHLRMEERGGATIEKYIRDVRRFYVFAGAQPLDKAKVIEYKSQLLTSYTVASANSMLAAVNAFLRFCGGHELCVKQFKVQRAAFRPEQKELTRGEYIRLVEAANRKGNARLNLIIQTICGTGIRVSELEYVTAEAVRCGEAVVNCKGKNRKIIIVSILRKKLLRYMKEQKIRTGPVFVTRGGRPVSRHNIWRDMKALCVSAGISPEKVFPHNLRHLFAKTFYEIEKDIAKLADILGHTSINTTRIYIATNGTEHRRKMENMRLII